MLHSDLTLGTAAEDLALDEALLDACEEGLSEPVLRFWEPRQTFVVVGYANRVAVETEVDACSEAGIPIFRRCTGGGTVLQAPGCLNYTLVLRIDSHPSLAGITRTNDYVMERNRAAAERAAQTAVQREGHTDLAISGIKFCGNAQRRRKHCLLFHGCFLLHCDLSLIGRCLRMPSKQPAYRRGRSHSEFVRNLNCPADKLKHELRLAWEAVDELQDSFQERVTNLVSEKYSRTDWNLKF